MSTNAVHFHGIDNIVAAFRNKGLPFFAVLSGKQIIHKNDKITDINEAADELEQFLEMLNSASNAIYTLKIFEEKPKGGIKENTPADYGLNFRLNLPDMLPASIGRERYIVQKQEQNNEIVSMLNAINARLDKMEAAEEEEEEEENEPQSIGAVANNALLGVLSDPQLQQVLATKLAGFVGNLFNASGKPAPAVINGVGGEVEDIYQDQIDTAIDTLCSNTPGGAAVLAEKLAKLAAMSINNQGQYVGLLSML